MSAKQFWRTTPALLNVLSAVHADLHNPHKQKIARTVEEAGINI
jgi:hypothetical protein